MSRRDLNKTRKSVFHAVGVSPAEVVAPGDNWRSIIEESVKLPKVVAIGETGL
ncbi:MAG: TatD family hydrolase, partial [Treponema sp.]|nr:TatD family hydrolase [Treponema sp.]